MPSFFLALGFYGILCSSSFSAGEDTLSTNGTLSEGQTLVSQNQDFELGFFSPAPSKSRFLGIWYKKTPDVVVWVANRDNPIKDSLGVVLKVARNQASVISRDGSIVWYSNSSTVASNPVLKLLDTGNLVLTDTDREPYSYIWQSFDYLIDTRLPGMLMVHSPDPRADKYLTSWKSLRNPARGDFNYEIENKGLAQMMITRKNVKIYRSGMWNGIYVNVPTFYNTVYKGHMVIRNNVTTFTDPYNSSILTRLVLGESGKLYRYTMNREKEKWNLVYTIPKDPCDDYLKCGPNGICRIERVPICGCLDGFTPKFQKNWDFQDWSDGCNRVKPLSCMNGDGFLEVKGVKYPDMVRFWLNKTMSISECRDECSRNCNCTSFAQPYINNGGRGCLIWFGDLIDTRVLPGADKNQNIYIRLAISELGKTTLPR